MGVAEIVKTDVDEFCLDADLVPAPVKPTAAARSPLPGRREDPAAPPLEPVQDVPARLRRPDGPGPRLAVAQEEMPVPVVGPAGSQDLALAASAWMSGCLAMCVERKR